MSSARRHRIARAQKLVSALVGFPNWHASGLGCGNLERVGWGTSLVSPCEAHHTRQDEAEAVSLSLLWMCELPEIHISLSLQKLTKSLETYLSFFIIVFLVSHSTQFSEQCALLTVTLYTNKLRRGWRRTKAISNFPRHLHSLGSVGWWWVLQ